MAEKRSPMNVYTVLLAGAALLAAFALILVVGPRRRQLTDANPFSILFEQGQLRPFCAGLKLRSNGNAVPPERDAFCF